MQQSLGLQRVQRTSFQLRDGRTGKEDTGGEDTMLRGAAKPEGGAMGAWYRQTKWNGMRR